MKSSKSSLFLMELIISILFFSMTSAACIQLFVKAHLLNVKTTEQNQTVMWTQNLAELWRAYDGDMLKIYTQLSADYDSENKGYVYLSNDGRNLHLYFDSKWNQTQNDITYIVSLSDKGYDAATLLSAAEISLSKNNEIFYFLPLSYHPALEGGNVHD